MLEDKRQEGPRSGVGLANAHSVRPRFVMHGWPRRLSEWYEGSTIKAILHSWLRAAITNRKLEQHLEESADKYRILCESLFEGFCIIEMLFDDNGVPSDYRFLEISPSFEQQTGLKNACGKRMRELAPCHEEHWFEMYGKVALTGESVRFENEASQLHRWFDVQAARIGDPRDRKVALTFTDITARKQSEEALKGKERHIRALLESTAEAITGIDPEGNCTFCNAAAVRLLAYEAPSELLGRNLYSIMHHARTDGTPLPLEACQLCQAICSGKSVHADEEVFWRKDGTCFPAECWSHPLFDQGTLYGAVVTFLDISGRKEAQEEFSLLKTALEATVNAVVITDRNGTIEWTNPAFTELTGYAAQEVIGRTPRVLRSGKHTPEFYEEMWRTIISHRVWSGELVNRRKDGTLYTEEMTITPVRSIKGDYSHFVAVKQDITARKSLEDQFRQAQKMEAVGTLAGGVAHDFNNSLCVISGYTGILDDHIGDDTTLTAIVAEIRAAVDSAATLTRQLLAFGRKQVLQPQVISPNIIVSNTIRLLRRIVDEDIVLLSELDPSIGNVMADPGQLQQVIMNLAVNARDAMPKGGSLTIATDNVDVPDKGVEDHRLLQPGRYVRLRLRDTGIGMTETTMRRAFEPFFTTKALGRGTGLGLATVYGIVKQSGGHVFLSSKVGEGTVADVYLASVNGTPSTPSDQRAVETPLTGDETILLVEDNLSLLKVIRNGLERRGYTVISAMHGAEGLNVAASYGKPIDLLITDCIMPGMDGVEFAKRLKLERPGLRVLYMSGHTDETLGDRRAINSNLMFIKKPFDLPALLGKVREALKRTESCLYPPAA